MERRHKVPVKCRLWTRHYGICSGNNKGSINFWVNGEWFSEPFDKFTCHDWFHNWGTTVEVSGFTID